MPTARGDRNRFAPLRDELPSRGTRKNARGTRPTAGTAATTRTRAASTSGRSSALPERWHGSSSFGSQRGAPSEAEATRRTRPPSSSGHRSFPSSSSGRPTTTVATSPVDEGDATVEHGSLPRTETPEQAQTRRQRRCRSNWARGLLYANLIMDLAPRSRPLTYWLLVLPCLGFLGSWLLTQVPDPHLRLPLFGAATGLLLLTFVIRDADEGEKNSDRVIVAAGVVHLITVLSPWFVGLCKPKDPPPSSPSVLAPALPEASPPRRTVAPSLSRSASSKGKQPMRPSGPLTIDSSPTRPFRSSASSPSSPPPARSAFRDDEEEEDEEEEEEEESRPVLPTPARALVTGTGLPTPPHTNRQFAQTADHVIDVYSPNVRSAGELAGAPAPSSTREGLAERCRRWRDGFVGFVSSPSGNVCSSSIELSVVFTIISSHRPHRTVSSILKLKTAAFFLLVLIAELPRIDTFRSVNPGDVGGEELVAWVEALPGFSKMMEGIVYPPTFLVPCSGSDFVGFPPDDWTTVREWLWWCQTERDGGAGEKQEGTNLDGGRI